MDIQLIDFATPAERKSADWFLTSRKITYITAAIASVTVAAITRHPIIATTMSLSLLRGLTEIPDFFGQKDNAYNACFDIDGPHLSPTRAAIKGAKVGLTSFAITAAVSNSPYALIVLASAINELKNSFKLKKQQKTMAPQLVS